MIALPWLLLASTLLVRLMLARKVRAGFYLDIVSVPFWLAYYLHNGSYPLLAVPVVFGCLDYQALRRWWA